MKNLLLFLCINLTLWSCQSSKEWQMVEEILLDDITPIGIAFSKDDGGLFWIADGDNNKVYRYSKDFRKKEIIGNFERPMHLDESEGKVYIPEYGSDEIKIYHQANITSLEIQDSLDAPASISIWKEEIGIADFYHHRILYFDGQEWISIGKKGKEDGEFHYPTDLQITSDKIYVADAYNHRVQVFNKDGKFLHTFGKKEKMNASTGIYVGDQQIFVTDFEHDRLLVYDTNGTIEQIIDTGLNKPTDALIVGQQLYVLNYKGKSICIFK